MELRRAVAGIVLSGAVAACGSSGATDSDLLASAPSAGLEAETPAQTGGPVVTVFSSPT